MAKTIEELRAEYPELTQQLEDEARVAASVVYQDPINAAVAAERKRLQEIDEIAEVINDPDLVRESKYGEKSCTAKELALSAAHNVAADRGVAAAKSSIKRDY